MKKTMKIMAMVLFVLGITALSSCTKEKQDKIVGKWELESISVSYMGQTYEMTVDEYAAMFGDLDDMYLEFKEDGKVNFEGEYASYTVDGDVLKITDGEEVVSMNITELTNSVLVLEQTEVDEDTGEAMTVALHFKKV